MCAFTAGRRFALTCGYENAAFQAEISCVLLPQVAALLLPAVMKMLPFRQMRRIYFLSYTKAIFRMIFSFLKRK
jgi:hypothetical protein